MAVVHCAILASLHPVNVVGILNMNATQTIAGFAPGVAGSSEVPGLQDRGVAA